MRIGKRKQNVKYYKNKRSQPIPQKKPDTEKKKKIPATFQRKKH